MNYKDADQPARRNRTFSANAKAVFHEVADFVYQWHCLYQCYSITGDPINGSRIMILQGLLRHYKSNQEKKQVAKRATIAHLRASKYSHQNILNSSQISKQPRKVETPFSPL